MSGDPSFMQRQYRLEEPPFRGWVATALDLESWVDRDNEVSRWEKALESAISSPRKNFLVLIIGDYGMGKSLSLFKVMDLAKKHGKHNSIYYTYLNFISEQKPKNPGLDFLQRIFRAVKFEGFKPSRASLSVLETLSPDVPAVYERIFYGQDPRIREVCIATLRGEIKPTATQLKDMGIIRKVDDVDIAKQYLIGLLYLMKASGRGTLLLAVDELEYMFSLVPKPSQSIYLALLRGLIDLHVQVPIELHDQIANLIMYVGLSEDGFRRLTELENIEGSTGGPIRPLMRRIADRTSLLALSKENSRDLITKRLSLNRVKGRYEGGPLIPFTDDFIDYLFRLTTGRPGDIISRCDIVLDAGLEKRAPRLTAEFAREALREKGFAYE
jgi:hypothetical protein